MTPGDIGGIDDQCCTCDGDVKCVCPDTYANSGNYVGIDKGIQPTLQNSILSSPEIKIYWGCFPAGVYRIRYCGGIQKDSGEPTNPEPVYYRLTKGGIVHSDDLFTGELHFFYKAIYMSGGVETRIAFNEPEPPNDDKEYGYLTLAEAEAVETALMDPSSDLVINHSGGKIGILYSPSYEDDPGGLTEPAEGHVAPRFALCRLDHDIIQPTFTAEGVTCAKKQLDGKFQATFTLGYSGTSHCVPINGISATLTGSTVVNINSSTTVSGINVPAGTGTFNVTLEFGLIDETVRDITAHLQLSGGELLAPVTVDFDMAPSLDTITAGTNCGFVTGGRYAVSFCINSTCEYENVTATVRATDQILSPTTATIALIGTVAPTCVTIEFDLADETHKDISAVLLLSDGELGTYYDLTYDLTPVVSVDAVNTSQSMGTCGDSTHEIDLTVSTVSGLPCCKVDGTADLTLTPETNPIATDGTLAALWDNYTASCASVSSYPVGTNSGGTWLGFACGSGNAVVVFMLTKVWNTGDNPPSVEFIASWQVGAVSLPDSIISGNITW